MSNANRNSNSQNSHSSANQPTNQPGSRSTGRPTVRLDYERSSGRQLGFLGFSVVAHMAFLTALAFSSQSIKPIQEIGGGDGMEAGTGSGTEISIVEVNDAGQPLAASAIETAATEPTMLVDESSAITAPAPVKTAVVPSVTAPVEKAQPVAKTPAKPIDKPVVTKQPKAAPVVPVVTQTAAPEVSEQPAAESQVITEESTEAPVLLANPPEDKPEEASTAEAPVEEAKAEEAPVPVLAAVAPTEKQQPEPETQPEPEVQPAPQSEQESAVAPVAIAQSEEKPAEATTSKPAETAAISQSAGQSNQAAGQSEKPASGVGNSESGTGSTEETKGTGSGTVIAGPIRDASELKALPGNPNPVYPARDRFNRKQGTAFVLGRVMPDGRIGQVVLEKSSGSPSMDAESAKAFRNWRFQPGQQGWVRKPFQFRLVGEAKEVPAPLGKQLKRQ
jgi:TonB family protein